jgi:hypothetical protein
MGIHPLGDRLDGLVPDLITDAVDCNEYGGFAHGGAERWRREAAGESVVAGLSQKKAPRCEHI